MQLQQKATPEDSDIAAILEEVGIKFQKTLETLQASQSKNSDRIFNTGYFSIIRLLILVAWVL